MKEDLSWRSIETGLGDLRRGLNSLNSDTDFYLCFHNFVYNANVSLFVFEFAMEPYKLCDVDPNIVL